VADFSLYARSGLEHLLQPGNRGDHTGEPGVAVTLRSDLALAYVLVRNGKTGELQSRIHDRFGVQLPMAAQHAEGDAVPDSDGLSFVWAGPGRWLAKTSAQSGAALETTLRNELSGIASIIGQTDGRCVFRISGPSVRAVLAKGLPIDLDPRAFAPGDTALTLVAHISVHIWQLDNVPTYELAVPRSFAASFCEWLFAAAASHGVVVRNA
jgi:methylglutamate dehydrogenase subunit D